MSKAATPQVRRNAGQSLPLSDPTFIYDASGLACLDTLKDFIEENNPEGLDALACEAVG